MGTFLSPHTQKESHQAESTHSWVYELKGFNDDDTTKHHAIYYQTSNKQNALPTGYKNIDYLTSFIGYKGE